ncbi:MAG: spore germination protein [Clostridia bacterium]|nr:spore germination protein [Clostridia bacterium]
MKKSSYITQEALDKRIGAAHAFDIKKRPITVGGRQGWATFIIGYTDQAMTERTLYALQGVPQEEEITSMEALMAGHLSFASSEVVYDIESAAREVLRGSVVLLLEGVEGALVADARSFSMRSTQEPEKDRTLRGPHVGTNESLISNLVQIRRHLRCATLQTERFLLGEATTTEVAVLSLSGRADEKLLDTVRHRLQNARVTALTLTQETLAGILVPQRGLGLINPFPRVRYTERPDVVAATLMEGKIAVLCDNSPSVILLPESVFDFFEEADDYYFPPVTASYLRLVRIFVFLSSVFLIPGWLLAVRYAKNVPHTLHFILAEDGYAVPLFLQFLIIELAMDGLKMASLNTPSTLSGSFSVIGGLLLGEYAVKSGWFVPQTILYSAFTGIANFVPTNYELGYSFKFMRMSLIFAVEWFGLWGLIGGCVLWLGLLVSTKSIGGTGYLAPFFPFDPKGITRLFFRHRKGKEELPH